ncbi:hypothetical protein EMCRGX_G002332 [Ephydatia muelleri]
MSNWCSLTNDLQHHSVAESGDYEESLIRQEYMVAGVDRQNENVEDELATEEVEDRMASEGVEDTVASVVEDRMATEELEDRMASEGLKDMMASDVEDSQKLEDEVTSEEVKDGDGGDTSGGHCLGLSPQYSRSPWSSCYNVQKRKRRCHPPHQLRNVLAETCRRAHLSVKVEMGSNLTSEHDHSHPADILLPNWALGKPAAFDISVTSPLNPKIVSVAGLSAGAAALSTEERKHTENDPKCNALGWCCVLTCEFLSYT